jgi:DNA-binding transcriptional MerR regulator
MLSKLSVARCRTYSMGELRREYGVTARALRFYEEQGLLFPARRNLTRLYSYKDRARLALILRGRRVGLSVAEIRDILDLYEEEGEAAQSARALKVFEARVEALKAEREAADMAIAALEAAAERLTSRFPQTARAPGAARCA